MVMAIVSYILAFLVKQDAVTLPVIASVLILGLWPDSARIRQRYAFGALMVLLITMVWQLEAISSVRDISQENRPLVDSGLERTLPPLEYSLTAIREFSFYYFWRLFAPLHLNVDPLPAAVSSFAAPALLASVTLLAGLSVLAIRMYWRDRLVSACLGMVLISPLAAYCVFPLADVVSEHRAYVAAAGAVILIAALLEGRKWGVGLLLGILIVFGAGTLRRNAVWQNEEKLWTDAAAKSPRAIRPHMNLGAVYTSQGRSDLAEAEYLKVLALSPDNSGALANLGLIYLQQGDLAKAESPLTRAVESGSLFPAVYVNLAVLRLRQGRSEDARGYLLKARALNGNEPLVGVILGDLAFSAGDVEKAMAEYRSELKIDPESSLAHQRMAEAYERLGDTDRANVHREAAARSR
jgi:Flp pilus assembly protein TadD